MLLPQEYVDYNTWQTEVMPLGGEMEPKRRFLPSKWEAMKVAKIIKGIKEGRIVLSTSPLIPRCFILSRRFQRVTFY